MMRMFWRRWGGMLVVDVVVMSVLLDDAAVVGHEKVHQDSWSSTLSLDDRQCAAWT